MEGVNQWRQELPRSAPRAICPYAFNSLYSYNLNGFIVVVLHVGLRLTSKSVVVSLFSHSSQCVVSAQYYLRSSLELTRTIIQRILSGRGASKLLQTVFVFLLLLATCHLRVFFLHLHMIL